MLWNNFSTCNYQWLAKICFSGDTELSSNANGHNQTSHDIEEENFISDEYADALDMTCLEEGLIRAPHIHNGEVVRYTRKKKGSKVFLVAFYECDDGFVFDRDSSENFDRVYCSQEQWVGNYPQCVSANGEEGV